MIVSLMVLMITGDCDCLANGVDDERRLMVSRLVLRMTGYNDGF